MTLTDSARLNASRIASAADTEVKAMGIVMVIKQLPVRLWRTIRVMDRNRRSRLQLAALTDHLLQDIGLTPEERDAEVRKPFWQD